MEAEKMEQLRFPVGRFRLPRQVSPEELESWINVIAEFPAKLAASVADLSPEQLAWRYRPEGWTIKQVVHHCADSHINSFTRYKLALTEDAPTIRPYEEAKWAELPDGQLDNLTLSLGILHGIHARWHILLRNMSPEEFKRYFIHPEHGRSFTLEAITANYAWHCDHHHAHVLQALESKGSYNEVGEHDAGDKEAV